MTPTADPTPLHIIMETTGGSEGISAGCAALIAASISSVAAVLTAWLTQWYSNKRHRSDLKTRHEDSLRVERIKALHDYNQEVTKFVRFVAGGLNVSPSTTSLLELQGRLDILFNAELVNIASRLTERSVILLGENTRHRNGKAPKPEEEWQADGKELIQLRENLLAIAREHITQPPDL